MLEVMATDVTVGFHWIGTVDWSITKCYCKVDLGWLCDNNDVTKDR